MAAEDQSSSVQYTFVDHGQRPIPFFFSRLEDQSYGRRQVFLSGEQCCGAEQHRHVSIVPAGVHDAAVHRGEFQAGFFLNGERIRIGPEHHAGHAGFSGNICDDTGTCHIGTAVKTDALKKVVDHSGCTRFLPTQLRIPMQRSSQCNQPFIQVLRN